MQPLGGAEGAPGGGPSSGAGTPGWAELRTVPAGMTHLAGFSPSPQPPSRREGLLLLGHGRGAGTGCGELHAGLR